MQPSGHPKGFALRRDQGAFHLRYASEYFPLRGTAHWAVVFLDPQGDEVPLTPFRGCASRLRVAKSLRSWAQSLNGSLLRAGWLGVFG